MMTRRRRTQSMKHSTESLDFGFGLAGSYRSMSELSSSCCENHSSSSKDRWRRRRDRYRSATVTSSSVENSSVDRFVQATPTRGKSQSLRARKLEELLDKLPESSVDAKGKFVKRCISKLFLSPQS